VSRSTFVHIMNVAIERRHKCLTVGGEEEGRCGCGVGVIHRGIPYGGACPPVGGAHDGDQYPWPGDGGGVLELWPGWPARSDGSQYPPGGSGGQYPTGSNCGGHVEGCPAAGDPPQGITGVGSIREPCNMKV
jgi:hypothetical protein